jgi:hypothetical protein
MIGIQYSGEGSKYSAQKRDKKNNDHRDKKIFSGKPHVLVI